MIKRFYSTILLFLADLSMYLGQFWMESYSNVKTKRNISSIFFGLPIENLKFNNQTIDYHSMKVILVREVIGCNDSTSWILLLICRMKCWASNQLRRNSWVLRRDNYYCFLEETKVFLVFLSNQNPLSIYPMSILQAALKRCRIYRNK